MMLGLLKTKYAYGSEHFSILLSKGKWSILVVNAPTMKYIQKSKNMKLSISTSLWSVAEFAIAKFL